MLGSRILVVALLLLPAVASAQGFGWQGGNAAIASFDGDLAGNDLSDSDDDVVTIEAGDSLALGSYFDLSEMADPGVPGDDTVRLWAEDDELLGIASPRGSVYVDTESNNVLRLWNAAKTNSASMYAGAGNELIVGHSGGMWNVRARTYLHENNDAALGGTTNGGLQLANDNAVGFSSTTSYSGAKDTIIGRLAANVLYLDGDGSQTTAAKLAVSGIAPIGSSTPYDDVIVYNADGMAMATFDSSADLVNFEADMQVGAAQVIDYQNDAAPDSTTPTLANLPTGGTAGQVGWLVIEVDGTTSYVPYWQLAPLIFGLGGWRRRRLLAA